MQITYISPHPQTPKPNPRRRPVTKTAHLNLPRFQSDWKRRAWNPSSAVLFFRS